MDLDRRRYLNTLSMLLIFKIYLLLFNLFILTHLSRSSNVTKYVTDVKLTLSPTRVCIACEYTITKLGAVSEQDVLEY